MRVAYVNADCGIPIFGDKGACVHIQEMVRAMRMCGADVRIVATRFGTTSDVEFAADSIHAFRNRDGLLKDLGRSAKELANVADAEVARDALIALHARWPFDMIYERYSLWSKAGIEAGQLLGVPVILEVNAPLLREQQEFRELDCVDLATEIEQSVFGKADCIVTVSSKLSEYVISRGAAPERVTAIGNAVDLKRFHPGVTATDVTLRKDAFVVGFTGSLKRWHGVDVMMEAFCLLRDAVPEAHLLIVGDGPERGWLEGYVRGARLDDAVTMAGWKHHAELPELIAAMHVALAPYPETDDFYFSPLKLFEYLAIGRPIVASAIGQITEVIRHGENGHLVPPGDARALAEALIALRANPSLSQHLAQGAAREGAKHSWQRNAEAALNLGKQFRKAA
jgi:glycosyltransferase involved in cell wall biosynthesis